MKNKKKYLNDFYDNPFIERRVCFFDNAEWKDYDAEIKNEKTEIINQDSEIIWEVTPKDLDKDVAKVEDILMQNLNNTVFWNALDFKLWLTRNLYNDTNFEDRRWAINRGITDRLLNVKDRAINEYNTLTWRELVLKEVSENIANKKEEVIARKKSLIEALKQSNSLKSRINPLRYTPWFDTIDKYNLWRQVSKIWKQEKIVTDEQDYIVKQKTVIETRITDKLSANKKIKESIWNIVKNFGLNEEDLEKFFNWINKLSVYPGRLGSSDTEYGELLSKISLKDMTEVEKNVFLNLVQQYKDKFAKDLEDFDKAKTGIDNYKEYRELTEKYEKTKVWEILHVKNEIKSWNLIIEKWEYLSVVNNDEHVIYMKKDENVTGFDIKNFGVYDKKTKEWRPAKEGEVKGNKEIKKQIKQQIDKKHNKVQKALERYEEADNWPTIKKERKIMIDWLQDIFTLMKDFGYKDEGFVNKIKKEFAFLKENWLLTKLIKGIKISASQLKKYYNEAIK